MHPTLRLGLLFALLTTACGTVEIGFEPLPSTLSPLPPSSPTTLSPSSPTAALGATTSPLVSTAATATLPPTQTSAPTVFGVEATNPPPPTTVPTALSLAATATPLAVSFSVSPTTLNPGEMLYFAWTAPATMPEVRVVEVLTLADGSQQTLQVWNNLPLSGALAVATRTENHGTHILYFEASDNAQVEQRQVTVQFNCPYAYFFTPAPAVCPDGAAQTVTVGQQNFEQGRMVRLQNGDHDTSWIYILFADGTVQKVYDRWTDDQPEADPTLQPPAGFYSPTHGFGLAWLLPNVSARLGWATAPQQTFTAPYQTDSRPYVTSEALIYRPELFYLTLAEGQTLKVILSRGYMLEGDWITIAP